MATRCSLRRTVLRALIRPQSSSISPKTQNSLLFYFYNTSPKPSSYFRSHHFSPSNFIYSRHYSSPIEKYHVPAPIDYRSTLSEDEYHELASSTIHDLLEKLEEYGDSVEIDGFDVDYGNDVLTLRLGNLGTYVINKQTPNRQIWMSSPVSGPSRFDWDQDAEAWIYRRTKGDLIKLLETELKQLCGEPISLS